MWRTWPWAAALLSLAAACALPRGEGAERFELFVLGTAQDGGLPHLGCDRACCAEARRRGRRVDPTSLGIHDRETGRLVLVEATPAIEAQVALLHRLAGVSGRGRTPVDAVLVTHAHAGHYTGLLQFGREAAATRDLPVHVSPAMAAFLRAHQPFRQLVDLGHVALSEFAPGVPFEPVPGLEVTALPVPHRDELSDTHAFRIRGASRTVLFVPDADTWGEDGEVLYRLLEGADVAYLDGTFYEGRELPDRPIEEVPHPPMVETMERLADRARLHPGTLRFLHLNHSNPALTDPALQRALARRGFAVARVGEKMGL